MDPDFAVVAMSGKGDGGRAQSVFVDKSTLLGRCKCRRNPFAYAWESAYGDVSHNSGLSAPGAVTVLSVRLRTINFELCRLVRCCRVSLQIGTPRSGGKRGSYIDDIDVPRCDPLGFLPNSPSFSTVVNGCYVLTASSSENLKVILFFSLLLFGNNVFMFKCFHQFEALKAYGFSISIELIGTVLFALGYSVVHVH